jgi:hypothetical protein
MTRRVNDLYSTVESSTVDELAELLAAHIKLRTSPLFIDVEHWRGVCLGLNRIAHLVATKCGFRIDAQCEYYNRPSNLPLGKPSEGVDLYPIRGRVGSIIHAQDPSGVLWTLKP